jgi:hypothetical protein
MLNTVVFSDNINYTKHIKHKRRRCMMRWVSITDASKELGIPHIKISRMARKGEIKSESNPLNARVRLVDLDELRELVNKRDQLLGKPPTQAEDTPNQTKEAL